MESQPQNPEWKVSLKILNLGTTLKTFTHADEGSNKELDFLPKGPLTL